ncbi:MAG: YkgJ family cysteine cluster protein [Cytophagales bacterium]|nr:YkgJ family cysteine cluster protein [Cytophagales bacterium]
MANENLSRNTQLIKRLKKKKPKDLDDQFSELHDEVFETTDCLTCANCCKTTSPIFLPTDISRVSKRLGIRPAEFHDRYLKTDEDGDFVLTQAPCPFLLDDNTCEVYDVRPKACREYPHTNRKRMHQILNLTLKNSTICPAVDEILGKLEKVYA